MGESSALRLRTVFLLVGLAFAVTLGIVVGQRLSAEAMAVIFGVVAGVLASIPTSLIVVFMANRASMAPRSQERPVTVETAEPRIVVVQTPAPPAMPPAPLQAWSGAYGYTATPPSYPVTPGSPRKFMVVGGGELDVDEVEGGNPWSQ